MERPLQNGQFGSKIKNAKNMRKTILQEHWSCSLQKSAQNNTKFSRNETIKNAKNMRKTILQEHWSCFVQKGRLNTPNTRKNRPF